MFKDPTISERLAENGYVVIDAQLGEEADRMSAYIRNNFSYSGEDFYYSLLANSYEVNKVLRDFIKKELNGFYEHYFQDYRTVTESFLMKPANTQDEMLLHQDWSYTDEREYEAYNVWIPLIDVTKENGAMIFLPGSHLWFGNIRSSTLPTARIASNYFLDYGATVAEMKKGQALIFNPAVFHGSYPNCSIENREVVTATVMNKEAPFLYFQQDKSDEVRVLNPDDDAFLRELHPLAVGGDGGLPEKTRIPYSYVAITEEELQKRVQKEMPKKYDTNRF